MEHTQAAPIAAPSWSVRLRKIAGYVAATVTALCLASILSYEKDDRYFAAQAFARNSLAVAAEVGEVQAVRMRRTLWMQAPYLFSQDRLYQFRVCGTTGSVKVALRASPGNAAGAYHFALLKIEH